MILVFDHIGIVVKDLDLGMSHLCGMLNELEWSKRFDDIKLGVSVRFARDNAGIIYELIAPFGDVSPVDGVLRRRVNLLNQIAYRTKSLADSADTLRKAGAVAVTFPQPAIAFGGARIQFMMSPLGFLVELVETDVSLHYF